MLGSRIELLWTQRFAQKLTHFLHVASEILWVEKKVIRREWIPALTETE